jgi:uncharacterized protein YkwD
MVARHTETMTRWLSVIAVAAALVAATASAVLAADTTEGTAYKDAAPGGERVTDVPGLKAQLLTEINNLRREQGLTPLKASVALAAAAREQSVSMARHGFFAHSSYNGSPFWKRVATRYRRPAAGSWSVGENLVWRSPKLSARAALTLWLQSPPHRQNLLNPVWREVGIAAVHASSAPGVYAGHDVTILTADFGVRR